MIYKTQYNEQIESLFEKRNSLFPIKQEDVIKLYKKYRLEFNYNSNHIEGNTLTYGQTQLLLLFDKSSGDVPMSDLEEMKAHDVALKMIQEVALEKGRPLTEQLIKEINKTILVRSFWKEAVTADGIATRKQIVPGEYKSSPNSVRLRNGEIHHYASPEETSAKMNDLMDWYRENETKMNPVQLAAEFHYRFVSIHPFDDGNGRVARLMMNYILFKFDYPMIIIKSKDKENYLTALQKADIGDRQAIIEYIERQMLWSLKLDIKAANGEDLEEDDDIDKEIVLLRREKLENHVTFKSKNAIAFLLSDGNKLWDYLKIQLGKFDDFFTDIKDTSYYSYGDSKNVCKAYDIDGSFISKYEPEFDLYFYELDFLKMHYFIWERKLLYLKTAKSKVDYRIFLGIELFDSTYKIQVKFANISKYPVVSDHLTIYKQVYNYNIPISELDSKYISKETANCLIEMIKRDK